MTKMKASFVLTVVSVSFLILGVMALAGCSSSKGVPQHGQEEIAPADLAGDWVVLSVLSDGTEYSVPAGLAVTFSADAQGGGTYAIYGFGGVNNYNTSATVAGSDFSVGEIATTLMAGDPEMENFERIFLDVLASADTITFSAGSSGAVIGDSIGRNAVILKRLGLEDSGWVLTSYNTGNAVASLDSGIARPEIVFGADGSVSGFTGVNYLTGSYELDNGKRTLSFSQMGTTRMAAADEDAAKMEQDYLDLLGRSSVYQLSGDTLRLLDKSGKTLLVFTRK